jgi:predicted  nucleic acid-binding Zn-ribbon protein
MPSRKPAEPSRVALKKEPAAAPPSRDPLTTLVLLQDLDLLIRDASDPKQAAEVHRLGFRTEGMDGLKTARAQLAATLEPRTLRLYEQVARRFAGRALVPVKNRICLGCSGVLPTGRPTDSDRILACQSCGRILYPL